MDSLGYIVLPPDNYFIFNAAHHKGTVSIPNPIIACNDLSAEAKLIYILLLMYAQSGRTMFPSIYALAILANISPNSVTKYINELIAKGFIRKEKMNGGKCNYYYLNEIHKIKSVIDSEKFWKVLDEKAKEEGWYKTYNTIANKNKKKRHITKKRKEENNIASFDALLNWGRDKNG